MVVFLHGFCLPDDAQQQYNFTAVRAGAGVGGTPRRQTLTQRGLRDFVDEVFYVTPTSPSVTRQCALCNLGEDSPNVADRLTTTWINQTLARVAPAFSCPTWDGSDACCAPERGGQGDDVRFIASVIDAMSSAYRVDPDRVYLIGIATGGFMVNRFVCERPDKVTAAMTFAGGTWNDPKRCTPAEGVPFQSNSVSILNVHGDADSTVPISGGKNFAGVPFPSAERTVETLSNTFACDPSSEAMQSESFTLPVPKNSPAGPVEVDVARRNGCGADKSGTVERWTLRGVDHFWEQETGVGLFQEATKWLFARTKSRTAQ
jgi:poly(3-hydroxybutyrate) depolymerase